MMTSCEGIDDDKGFDSRCVPKIIELSGVDGWRGKKMSQG